MAMPPEESIIGGGISGVVYALNDFWVLKAASGFRLSHQELAIERKIYDRLSTQRQILLFFEWDPRGLILERSLCPLRAFLRYLQVEREALSKSLLMYWAGQVVGGLGYIHSKGVFQGNIGCHNLLIHDNGDLKFSDFGGSSIDGSEPTVLYETHSQHPTLQGPNHTTELFALGTTLYEMSTNELPHPDVNTDIPNGDNIQSRYTLGLFPDMEDLMLGDIISGCWEGSYYSTLDVTIDMQLLSVWESLRPAVRPVAS